MAVRKRLSAAYTVQPTDKERILVATTGTWTLSLPAASVLGPEWWCYVENAGFGTMTVDPNGAETIDGGATLALTHADMRILTCDGVSVFETSPVGLADDAVTFAKLQDISADRLIGRDLAGVGDPEEILVGGGLGFTGGGAIEVAARGVTFAKTQAINTARLLGRVSGASGDIEELTPANVLSIIGTAPTSFTPTLVGSTVAGTPTYTNQIGRYTKIFDLVFVQGQVTISAIGGMTGNVRIGGLPVATANEAVLGLAWVTSHTGVTYTASYSFLSGIITGNTTQIRLNQNGTGVSALSLPVSGIAATTDIVFGAAYLAA